VNRLSWSQYGELRAGNGHPDVRRRMPDRPSECAPAPISRMVITEISPVPTPSLDIRITVIAGPPMPFVFSGSADARKSAHGE
jgi:hypothetical protein